MPSRSWVLWGLILLLLPATGRTQGSSITPTPALPPLPSESGPTPTPIPRIPLAVEEDLQPPTDQADETMGFIGGTTINSTSTPVNLENLKNTLSNMPTLVPATPVVTASSTLSITPTSTTIVQAVSSPVLQSSPAGAPIVASPAH